MYRRRKLLLALIEAFDGSLDRLRFQKMLFLVCTRQKEPSFYFLPYKYGCFSFQANMDLVTLEKKDVISKNCDGLAVRDGHWIDQIDDYERKAIAGVKREFGAMSDDELIRYTYTHFPFYATRSTIAKKHLNDEELQKVRDSASSDTTPLLATLGYEGLSIEQYINILLKMNISLLCDVRKNAMSMKYGFSKKTLNTACENVGIVYVHVPEVGIDLSQRKDLKTPADYRRLFESYRSEVLAHSVGAQQELAGKIAEYKRAALLCFEKDEYMCHRSHLAKALITYLPQTYSLKHIHG